MTYLNNSKKKDNENVISYIPWIRRIQRYQQENKISDGSIPKMRVHDARLLSDRSTNA